MKYYRLLYVGFLVAGLFVQNRTLGVSTATGPASTGRLVISFVYMPPGEVHPTYHTAIWLENEDGKLVKTLYVSQELSDLAYKRGNACPDWVKQAYWEKAEKSVVDAVTGATPNVGSGSMVFDLDELGIAPGIYRVCFQVHFIDDTNILYRGTLSLGKTSQEADMQVLYSPSGPPAGAADVVRYVQAHYVPE